MLTRRHGWWLVLAAFAGGASLTLAFALVMTAAARPPAVLPPAAQAGPTIRYVAPDGHDAGPCNLPAQPCASAQYAVDRAAAGDEVRLAQGTYTGVTTRAGTTQLVYITKTLTLRGGWNAGFSSWQPQLNPTTLDAGGQGRAVVISGTIAPRLEGLHITDGASAGNGGGLYVINAAPTISGCTISGSHAAYGGGAFLDHSHAMILASQILSNTTVWHGSGLYLYNSPATVRDSRIAFNQTGIGNGGGLYLWQSAATFISDTIDNNVVPATGSALGYGGGVYLFASPAGITATRVLSNTAWAGGGLFLTGSAALLDGNVLAGNTATGDGVGVYLENSATILSGNTIHGNQGLSATGRGGGIFATASRPWIASNTIDVNHAGNGGGLYLERGIYLDFRGNRINGNTAAAAGGGLYLLGGPEGGPASLSENQFSNNTALASGGGIYAYNLIGLTVLNNTVSGNTSSAFGGGMFLDVVAAAAVGGNYVFSNTAATSGGGVYLHGGGVSTFVSNTLASNSAAFGGGLYLAGPAHATFTGNLVRGNVVTEAGGGLFLSSVQAGLEANALLANRATGRYGAGGGLYVLDGRAVLSNTLLAQNAAASTGSGAFFDGSAHMLLQTTVAGNRDPAAGHDGSGVTVGKRWSPGSLGASVTLSNSIVAGQTTGVLASSGGSGIAAATLWGRGAWANGQDTFGAVTSAQNFTGDPLFLAPGQSDYQLATGSPAIDRGVSLGVQRDLAGRPRPNPATGIPDLGAYEWYALHTYLPLVSR